MPTADTQKHADRKRDEALKESFPASDAPANTGVTGPGSKDKPSHERGIDERPTGVPVSDRHAAETVHHREDADLTTDNPA
jgi:hypothetical protein